MKLDKDLSERILDTILNSECRFFNMKRCCIFNFINPNLSIAIHKEGGIYIARRKVEFPFFVGRRIKKALNNIIKSNHEKILKKELLEYNSQLSKILNNK